VRKLEGEGREGIGVKVKYLQTQQKLSKMLELVDFTDRKNILSMRCKTV